MAFEDWLIETGEDNPHLLQYIAENSRRHRTYRRTPGLIAATLHSRVRERLARFKDLRFYPDVKLRPCVDPAPLGPQFFSRFKQKSGIRGPGLNEVLEIIEAPKAWTLSTGKDTYIAIIDSGVNGWHAEFPNWKKAGGWSSDNSDPWEDKLGHGTMCAAIAAACPMGVSRVSGVAPESKLYSCKVDYQISSIIAAYEWLEDRQATDGRPIIINNSFGFESRIAPVENGSPLPRDHPLAEVLRRVVASGMSVIFAAGNNHDGSLHKGGNCGPNTIWTWHSMPQVLTIGEVDERMTPWATSSRGPGEWSDPGESKPDCMAPTFGWVLVGQGYGDTIDGWGTSGAAPQAAGVAALIASRAPSLSRLGIYDIIRATCQPIAGCNYCVGRGLLQAAAAVGAC